MLILSLGVPRSGTILVFNILREILTRQKVPFSSVNANYPETTAFLSQYDFSGNVLMHAHNLLPAVQTVLPRADVCAFFNYRDPRDVVVSMMRLHDYSFEKCIELTDISFDQFRSARRYPKVMLIPYAQLLGSTAEFIGRIAERLGYAISPEVVSQIREATSLDAHRRIMREVAGAEIEVQERRNPRRTLLESTTYFINDRHIQSGKPGRWRDELTKAQQQHATAHFLPLLRELDLKE
ncbi:MAG: sulfotransferase domain-containing protein [Gammaproteobacteria bacterium]|nr:sulfotransferase domain-containing protein [Gammaproteobacteria bacterium]